MKRTHIGILSLILAYTLNPHVAFSATGCASPECVERLTIEFVFLSATAKPTQPRKIACDDTTIGDAILDRFNSIVEGNTYAPGDIIQLPRISNAPFAISANTSSYNPTTGELTINAPRDGSTHIQALIVPYRTDRGWIDTFQCGEFKDYTAPNGMSFGFIAAYTSDSNSPMAIFVTRIESDKTASLDFKLYNNNSTTPLSSMLGDIDLPTKEMTIPQKEGYTFRGWGSNYSKITAPNISEQYRFATNQTDSNNYLNEVSTFIAPNTLLHFPLAKTNFTWRDQSVNQPIIFYPMFAQNCNSDTTVETCDINNPDKPTCELAIDNTTGAVRYTTECCPTYTTGEIVQAAEPSMCIAEQHNFKDIITVETDQLLAASDSITQSFIGTLKTSIENNTTGNYGSQLQITPIYQKDTYAHWPFVYEINGTEYDGTQMPTIDEDMLEGLTISIKTKDDTVIKAFGANAEETPRVLAGFTKQTSKGSHLLQIALTDSYIIKLTNATNMRNHGLFNGILGSSIDVNNPTLRGVALSEGPIAQTDINSEALSNESNVTMAFSKDIMRLSVSESGWLSNLNYNAAGAYSFNPAYAVECANYTVTDCADATETNTPLCRLAVSATDGSVVYTNACCTEGYSPIIQSKLTE